MKKALTIVLALVLAISLFASCTPKTDTPAPGSTDNSQPETITIKVGASPTPHAEILAQAKPILAEQGITLEIVEYNDYVIPNTATEGGDIDANYFQHQPYLDSFNAENGTKLVTVASIHYEPFAIYAGRTASLADIKDGAKIAVPNDVTNEARALLLLEANGIIKLKDGVGLEATKLDISENPYNVEIIEIEAAQIARSLPDVDFAAINVNYALLAGLKVADALAVEDKDSTAADTYANIVVVKAGNENNDAIKKLCEALKTAEVRQFIESTYAGEVIPKF